VRALVIRVLAVRTGWPASDEVPTEEFARRQGARPITSVEDIHALAHPEARESDEEFSDFLVDLYASRHSGT
jgi:hypothetical protein